MAANRYMVHVITDVNVEQMTGSCRECGPVRIVQERRNRPNPQWRCETGERERRRRYEANNRERRLVAQREKRLRLRYGLTTASRLALHQEQNGRCAICGFEGELVIDHCHTSGAVRGLLCQPCNKALGFMQDSPARLAAAIEYLTRSP